jgi:hypothetical protein
LRREHFFKKNIYIKRETETKNDRKMAEMAGRKELALGHHRAFRTKNGRKWLLNREETKRKWCF